MDDLRAKDEGYQREFQKHLADALDRICPFRGGRCLEASCQAWNQSPPYPVRGPYDFCNLCRLRA